MIRRCGGLMWTLAARKRLGRKRIETNEPPRFGDDETPCIYLYRKCAWKVPRTATALFHSFCAEIPRFGTAESLQFAVESGGEKSLQASRHRIQALRVPRFDENPLEFAALSFAAAPSGRSPFMDGFLNILKPPGMSSGDMVFQARRLLPQGHARRPWRHA